jgi:hypothetical protein
MKKVLYPWVATIANCKENLSLGIIGQIEYHLHKDNSWVGLEFTSKTDLQLKKRKLEQEGYSYDKITYFEPTLYKLENPNLSANETFKYLTDYLTNLL